MLSPTVKKLSIRHGIINDRPRTGTLSPDAMVVKREWVAERVMLVGD